MLRFDNAAAGGNPFIGKDRSGNPMKAPSLWDITRSFLHLGATAYGGLAMVESIRRRIVQERGWLNQKEFLDGLALCQLVPGATVVQLATYVGYHLRKTKSALAAAAAFVFPMSFAYGVFASYLTKLIKFLIR
jgi:chromate transport protein ChrA